MDKPKIVYYSDCRFFAGSESMLANFISSEQLSLLYEVELWIPKNEVYFQGLSNRVGQTSSLVQLPVKQVELDGINSNLLAKLKFMGKSFLLFGRALGVIYQNLRTSKPAIFQINNGGFPGALTARAAAFAAKLAGVRTVIMVINNQAVPYNSIARAFDFLFDWLSVRSTTVFVTGSVSAKARLSSVLSLPDGKVRTINNGIARRQVTVTRDKYREKLGIGRHTVLYTVVALFEERKGHSFMVDAVGILANKFSPDQMRIVLEGDGPLRDSLIQKVQDSNLDEYFVWLQHESNVINLIEASDVLVLPSIRDEDFPNVVIEAMQQARPVIATRIAGIPEQILDGETGILVEPSEATSLSAAMETLLDAEMREQFGTASKNRFEACYRAEDAVLNYARLYENLLQNER